MNAVRNWINDPQSTTGEKALFTAAALTYLCLPLGTAPSTIAGALSLAIWLFGGIAIAKRRIYLTSYWWPVYGLMLLPWLGMLYTIDTTGIGMDYAEKTYYWLFGMSVAAIPFRYFSATRMAQAFMLGLGINVMAAIAQMAFHIGDALGQHRGLGPDYSTLSAYLIVGIMMGVFFLSRQQVMKRRIGLAGLIALYFFHLVILQSRASYVAFVLLAPFIGFTFFRRRKLIKTIALCVLTPCLMLLSPVVRDRAALTVEDLGHHLSATDGSAWGERYSAHQDRFYMWNGALRIIGDHPLIGVGTGGYAIALKKYGRDPSAPLIAHPHNNFLYIAACYGIVGSAVFCWFLVVTLVNGWRYRQTAAGYLLLSVIGVTVVTGLFNTQILDVGAVFLLSLTVGLQSAFPRSVEHG